MRYRLQAEKGKTKVYDSSINIISGTAFLTLLLTCGSWTLKFLVSYLSSISISIHPTSIPWIGNQPQCQHTGRTWRNGRCWDYEHNMMF
ncbi:MAG: hypothetical protein N2235_02645 [Fischerella sp.]|nr:hypothetical protein [Fischerella sp.]